MLRVVKIPMSGGSAASDLVIQVVMISESTRLQCMLANYGIQTQTPTEVEPVQVTNQSSVLFRQSVLMFYIIKLLHWSSEECVTSGKMKVTRERLTTLLVTTTLSSQNHN